MKKMRFKSLSVFIVLCLLLTGLFSTVVADPMPKENLNTEIVSEHDGYSHENSKPIQEGKQIEATVEDLSVIDEPIEPPKATSCAHAWTYHVSGFDDKHYKFCAKCGAFVYEPHNYTYHNFGSYHYTRCTICPLNRIEDHVADSSAFYYSDSFQGHHQKCKLCGGNTNITPHDFMYLDYDDEEHQGYCKKCSYTCLEEHEGDGNIVGSDPLKYERCKKCNKIMYIPCTHSDRICSYHNDTAHTVKCMDCNEFIGFENHSYKNVENGAENHKQICSECNYEKGTQPHSWKYVDNGSANHKEICSLCNYDNGTKTHSFSYKEDGNAGHYKHCATCGRKESTQSHTFVNGKCSVCGYLACQHSSFIYEQVVGQDSSMGHFAYCKDCGKKFTEPHYFGTTDSCIKCGWRPDGI